jgi:hypothetical protein
MPLRRLPEDPESDRPRGAGRAEAARKSEATRLNERFRNNSAAAHVTKRISACRERKESHRHA